MYCIIARVCRLPVQISDRVCNVRSDRIKSRFSASRVTAVKEPLVRLWFIFIDPSVTLSTRSAPPACDQLVGKSHRAGLSGETNCSAHMFATAIEK